MDDAMTLAVDTPLLIQNSLVRVYKLLSH